MSFPMDRTRLAMWWRTPETQLLKMALVERKREMGERALRPGVGMEEIEQMRGRRMLIDELIEESSLLGEMDKLAQKLTEEI